MGGGGLRILGHKRWHVWRRDNIERVERDERAQEQQERDDAAKRRRVEQERRVETLLRRSVADGHGEAIRTKQREEEDGEREHVNLFKKEEQEHAVALSRGERTARRTTQEQNETLGSQGRVPWYAQSGRALEETGRGDYVGQEQEQERKRRRELALADPLQHMRPARRDSERNGDEVDGGDDGASQKHKRLSGSDRRRYSSRYAVARLKHSTESEDESIRSTSSSDSERDSRRHRSGNHKSKKWKKKKDRKKSKRESLMDKLRRERDAREEKERRRADKILVRR